MPATKSNCDLCKLKKMEHEMETGKKLSPNACFFNPDFGDGCKYPKPEPGPIVSQQFKLWSVTEHCNYYAGMDGVAVGRDWSNIESAARALGIPWDEITLAMQTEIFEAWRDVTHKG